MALIRKSIENREQKNPYKGLEPYEVEDRHRFYGREAEKKKLFRLVTYNSVTVVFGKAGIGKTSLLNAGLFPQFTKGKEGFLPINLRLNYKEPALLEQARGMIQSKLKKNNALKKDETGDVEAFRKDETLWEYFHRLPHFEGTENKKITPVLVLDQFEEMFTIGKNHEDLDAWINELFYLIEDEFPEKLRNRILRGEEEFPYIEEPLNLRIIISLRQDYLPQLNSLKSRIPSIDRVMFQLMPLNGQQAREVINMPGGIQEKKVNDEILRSFYPDEVEEGKEVPDEKLEVEPSILSLICYQIVEEGKVKSFTQKDRERILTHFYDSIMREFPHQLEKFVEDKLLTEGGYRTLFRLTRDHPQKEYILQLVDRRILRKEYWGGKEYVEIIHDVLAPIVKEKRSRRSKKTKNLIIFALSGLLLFFIILTTYAFYQKNRANEQYRNAQVNRLTAMALMEFPKDNTRAIRIVEAAYEMGLPNPTPRTYQVLSDIAYSSVDNPFYINCLRHYGPVYNAVFSPDGRRILTASDDGTAKMWDLEGNLLVDLKKHTGRVFTAVFSADGNRILTASWDKTAKLWDVEGNLLLDLEHNGVVSSAVFSPDGSLIITACRDRSARVWNLEGKLLLELRHDGVVSSAVSSPDGKKILTASWDKSVKVWNLEGKLLVSLEHDEAVYSAVYSPDGSRILTVSEGSTVKIFDQEGKLLKNLEHNRAVKSALFSSDGSRILTALGDGTTKIWDIEGHLLTSSKRHDDIAYSAVFSPDGSQILTASRDGTAKVWELKNSIVINLNKHTEGVKTAVFSSDGSQILIASDDRTAKILDLKGNLQAELTHAGAVSSAVFSPDGRQILTASADNTARLWNREGTPMLKLTHGGAVSSAVFSPDGSQILTTSADSKAKIWDTKGKKLKDLTHDGPVSSAVFSPDGSRILTASDDGTAKLWDLKGNSLLTLQHHGPVSSAVFSPDGSQILTASWDNSAQLWDLKGNSLLTLRHDGAVSSVRFSPDGRRILTASRDGTAKLWDREGNLLADLNKHKGIVSSAVFSPKGSRILTASGDGTAKIWLTPEAIYDWLKEAKIPQLSQEDKENLGIR
jgi:WD40 repeat protein